MKPGQPSAIGRKRKQRTKEREYTEITPSPMAGKKCQEDLSPQESVNDGSPSKRAKCEDTLADPDPPSPEIVESREPGVDEEVPPESPDVTFVIDDDPPPEEILQMLARESERGEANQPKPSSAEDDEPGSGTRFWQAKYRKLKEMHDRYREETSQELNLLKEDRVNSELETVEIHWLKFHDRKNGYARDPGYQPLSHVLKRGYERISREVSMLLQELPRNVLLSGLLDAYDDPEYWLIAGECRRPWLKRILSEDYDEEGAASHRLWVAERVIMRYVLRCVFEPMLVGLDKEVESHLLRVRASMESRMVPTMADKWMGETLRSYTLLPKYDEDRMDYLNNHAKYLRGFMDRFFPIPEIQKYPSGGSIAQHFRGKIAEAVLQPAADLAAEMSFSYRKYELGWDYCDKTTEIFYGDLFGSEIGELEVLSLLGAKIDPKDFPGFGTEEKIGDVVLFVRPPIFIFGDTGNRTIACPPTVVVKPVSGYNQFSQYD